MPNKTKNRYEKPRRPEKRALGLLLSFAIFLSVFAMSGLTLSVGAASTAPDKDLVFGYGTDPSAIYIVHNVQVDKNATYRAYADSALTTLLGETYANIYASEYSVITLPYKMSYGVVFLTRQEEGQEESPYTRVELGGMPSVEIAMREVKDTAAGIPDLSDWSDSPNFYGPRVLPNTTNPATLKPDTYYQVEILLSNFNAISSVILPLHYDTSMLEPAVVKWSSSQKIKYIDTSQSSNPYLSAAASGTTVNIIKSNTPTSNLGTSAKYGLLSGYAFSKWSDNAAFTGTVNYQYVNTTTGLYKLQAGMGKTSTIAPFGTNSNERQFVRLYFKSTVTEATSITSLPVWFATEADCPAELRGTAQGEAYYDVTSPNGFAAQLCSANVMAPPPRLQAAGTSGSDAKVVALSAAEIKDLPTSYNAKVTTVGTLSENEVKIFNYTNWASTEGLSRLTMDGKLGYNDRLIIPGNSSALRENYEIRVYESTQYDSAYKSGFYDLNDGVDIDLGFNFLSKNGGTVYLAVAYYSDEEHTQLMGMSDPAQMPLDYPAEMSRDVTFRIYRSAWDDEDFYYSMDYTSTGDTGTHTGTPLQNVNRDEHLQIRVYFNNFYELMGYGFAIHFDPSYVRVADIDYTPMESGTVSEQNFHDEKSCFTVGKDLANITLTEQLIYQAWWSNDTEEIESLKTQLGLTQEEFDQTAQDVQMKYDAGIPNEGSALPWTGGLIFNEQTGDSGFPYVNNTDGVVRFSCAALQQTPLTLMRSGGYHFITINFVALKSGDPGFRLIEDGEFGYDILPGQQISLLGGPPELQVNEKWEVWPMGNKIEMKLTNGNALERDKLDDYGWLDAEKNADQYLFAGYGYRDPGYEVRKADGSRIPIADIDRYYLYTDPNDGLEKEKYLTYAADEAHMDFGIADGKYSAHYVLYYRYVTPDGTQTVQATRNIYTIYMKGDVNRDGEIDLFDEQALADELNGVVALTADAAEPTYALYLKKTVDLDQNGTIAAADRYALRDHNVGTALITQDYAMPAA